MARKHNTEQRDPLHGGRVQVPRSRGATSGTLLILLGAWGALIPFIGPWFSFAFSPDQSWHWTAARAWLEVLPGIVVLVGGVLLLLSGNRITASIGGWFAAAGGAWFVVGNNVSDLFHIGSPGTPLGSSKGLRTVQFLAYFDGLGVLILVLASLALGRLSVRSVRDVRSAQRREDAEATRVRQEEARKEQLQAREDARANNHDNARHDDPIVRQDEVGAQNVNGHGRLNSDTNPESTGATAVDQHND